MIFTSQAFQDKLQDASNRVIRMKIETYDTKMAVPTKGIPFKMYEWTGSGTPDWSGLTNLTQKLPSTGSGSAVLPNLAFNWSYSSPFYINVPYYGIEFSGYFYSEKASSDFGFYIFGDSQKVELEFNSVTHVISGAEVFHSPLQFAKSSSAVSVSASTWYQFKLRVWGETGKRHNGVCLQYTHNFSSVDEADFRASDLKIVNCGVTNTTNSFLSPTSVTHFSNIDGSRKRNEPTEYTFEVPLGDETGAYIRNSINEYVNGAITLHEGRLIKIWAGYECDSTPDPDQTEGDVVGDIEYIPRFSGFLHGFEANRNGDTLRVRCRDFFSRTEETFCINYPDASSYWSSLYFELNKPGEPDGIGTPVAYDRWNVVAAILDIFIKAGIPTSLFYGKEKGRATNGNVVDTVDSVYDADYNLSSASYYGTDQVEEYLNRYDVGTTLFEAVMKVVDTYGYDIEFGPDGNLRFFPKDNPTGVTIGESIIDDADASSDAAEETESAAQSGNFEWINEPLTTSGLEITFGVDGSGVAGTGFSLIVVRDIDSGNSNNNNIYTAGTASVSVDISIHGGASVWSDNFNFYFEETRYYGQGVSNLIGANPCVIELTRSLDYDNYDITITNLSTSYHVKVDQLWVYHNNTSESVKILQTYKTTGVIASISDLDYERSMEDLRNDILVVGQRKGIWVADGNQEVGIDDPEFSAEHNNQFVNYHSRSVDVESIYNPAAANYTGRHLMTYVQEPSINTYARADWLSFSMLDAYRNYKNKVNFSLIGDPEVYINDPVSVKDKVEEDGTNTVWVEGFSESINKTDWNVRIDVVGNKPFPSYTEDADYDPGDYNDGYFADLTVIDNFGGYRQGGEGATVVNGTPWNSSTIYTVEQNLSDAFPQAYGTGIAYSPEEQKYGIFYFSGISYSGGAHLTGVVWRYVTPEAGTVYGRMLGDHWKIKCAYNPYEESDYGCYVTFQFRCLVTGTISVGVKNLDLGVASFIAGMSNGGGLDERGLPKEQKVYPGEIITLIWGGVDEAGVTHKAVEGDDTEIGSGYFTQDGEYYFTMDYRRESDDKRISINTSNYTDENGNSDQKKIIPIIRSAQEEHTLTYSFEENTRNNIYNYTPGWNGGTYTSTGGSGRTNKDYVWVSTDGDINVTLKSFYLDTTRVYFAKYSVDLSRCKVAIIHGDTPIGWPNVERVIDAQDFQNGSPVNWDNTSGYIFPFNPDWNEYGALYNDGNWVNFYNEYLNYDWSGTQVTKAGMIYWFRLILDVRDASGRRIKYRNPNGNYTRLPEHQSEMWGQSDYAYSNRNWDTVLEFMQIPITIDDQSKGDFETTSAQASYDWGVPYWQSLRTQIPTCWAE